MCDASLFAYGHFCLFVSSLKPLLTSVRSFSSIYIYIYHSYSYFSSVEAIPNCCVIFWEKNKSQFSWLPMPVASCQLLTSPLTIPFSSHLSKPKWQESLALWLILKNLFCVFFHFDTSHYFAMNITSHIFLFFHLYLHNENNEVLRSQVAHKTASKDNKQRSGRKRKRDIETVLTQSSQTHTNRIDLNEYEKRPPLPLLLCHHRRVSHFNWVRVKDEKKKK